MLNFQLVGQDVIFCENENARRKNNINDSLRPAAKIEKLVKKVQRISNYKYLLLYVKWT
jgi:hypothetical protein